MLQIKSTKHLMGITLHGDYNDLNQLYDSLHRYLQFYFDNQYYMLDESEKKGTLNKKEAAIQRSDLSNTNDCILGLCYDIRHAFQGDRDFEYVENNSERIGALASCLYVVDENKIKNIRKKGNNGNLYFHVGILYPWALYYLFQLSYILDEWYLPDWFSHFDMPYNIIQLNHDRALIQLLLDTLWLHMQETLGDARTQHLYHYYENCSEIGSLQDGYLEAVCCCLATQANAQPDSIKKGIILSLCYEILTPDELYDYENDPVKDIYKDSRNDYEQINAEIERHLGHALITPLDFTVTLQQYLNGKEHFYESDLDALLDEMYGEINWDELEW